MKRFDAAPDATSKLCSQCGIRHLRQDFHQRAASKDGLQAWCKSCAAIKEKGRSRQNKKYAGIPDKLIPLHYKRTA